MQLFRRFVGFTAACLLGVEYSSAWSTVHGTSIRMPSSDQLIAKQSVTPSLWKHSHDNYFHRSTRLQSEPSDVSSTDLSLDDLKSDLVNVCSRKPKPSIDDVKRIVRELEDRAEQVRGLTNFLIENMVEKEVSFFSLSTHQRYCSVTFHSFTPFNNIYPTARNRTVFVSVWTLIWGMVRKLCCKILILEARSCIDILTTTTLLFLLQSPDYYGIRNG